jgi:hypothetical protein
MCRNKKTCSTRRLICACVALLGAVTRKKEYWHQKKEPNGVHWSWTKMRDLERNRFFQMLATLDWFSLPLIRFFLMQGIGLLYLQYNNASQLISVKACDDLRLRRSYSVDAPKRPQKIILVW